MEAKKLTFTKQLCYKKQLRMRNSQLVTQSESFSVNSTTMVMLRYLAKTGKDYVEARTKNGSAKRRRQMHQGERQNVKCVLSNRCTQNQTKKLKANLEETTFASTSKTYIVKRHLVFYDG